MSDAKMCDACGKFYLPSFKKNSKRPSWAGQKIYRIRLIGDGMTELGVPFDLCEECANSITEILNGKRGDKNGNDDEVRGEETRD